MTKKLNYKIIKDKSNIKEGYYFIGTSKDKKKTKDEYIIRKKVRTDKTFGNVFKISKGKEYYSSNSKDYGIFKNQYLIESYDNLSTAKKRLSELQRK